MCLLLTVRSRGSSPFRACLPPSTPAISTPPVLSFDNGRLFVTSTRPQLICYETDRGRAQWTLDLEDVVVAEPLLVKASADGSNNNNNGPGGGGDGVNEVLYVIEVSSVFNGSMFALRASKSFHE